jgi:hypothetical protein
MSTAEPITTVKTKVSFPISKEGPYHETHPQDTIVEVVRVAAMAHFKVTDDAEFAYVLTHHGEREDPDRTLESIDDGARALDFRLVKVITQG